MSDELDASVEESDSTPDPRQSELADLREVMDSKAGRRFMYRLLYRECTLGRSSYAQDPNDAAFNAGLQQVGIIIADLLDDACFELRQRMEQEARFVRDQNVIE
jgi:hypothetical protein